MKNHDVILNPSDFVAISNQAFEMAMPYVVIEGELAEFKVRKNQWLYFKVKDDYASVDCFGTVYMLPGPLQDGMKVRVAGRPKLHERFGFSFAVQSIAPAGEGSIKKAFEALKTKLDTEGLFDYSRKRQLPYPPEKIGIITSKEGAALGDFNKIIAARWPMLQVDVEDAFVQGEKAAESIIAAIDKFNKQADLVDALVITRGGGSAEDLNAFNDERLARSVAASRIPTIVAIGHEQDESLAELVADRRASTPSNAAELLVPDIAIEQASLVSVKKRSASLLSELNTKLNLELKVQIQRLENGFNGVLGKEKDFLEQAARNLTLLDPKNILKRGYVIVKGKDRVIKNASSAKPGTVDLVFADGTKRATIE